MTVDLILEYLIALSKQIKKDYGRGYTVDITIVGGAALIINSHNDSRFNCRAATTDIDYIKQNRLSDIRTSIYKIADRFGLSIDWLNSDMMNTTSYSVNILNYRKPYKTLNQTITVYVVQNVALACMKLMAFREDKYDLMDIMAIVQAEDARFSDYIKTFKDIYGVDLDPKKAEWLRGICSNNGKL